MWSIEILSFIAGFLLLFIALVGGGFKIKEIEMPRVSAVFRALSAIIGLVLIVIAIAGQPKQESVVPGKEKDTSTEIITETTSQTKVVCNDCKFWYVIWISNDTQYEGLLAYKPTRGVGIMRVKYYNGTRNLIIQEEMNQVSTDDGQYLEGRNPFDTETFQPLLTYVPDNLIMNNEKVAIFDKNGSYQTTLIYIKDLEATIRVFGLTTEDLNF